MLTCPAQPEMTGTRSPLHASVCPHTWAQIQSAQGNVAFPRPLQGCYNLQSHGLADTVCCGMSGTWMLTRTAMRAFTRCLPPSGCADILLRCSWLSGAPVLASQSASRNSKVYTTDETILLREPIYPGLNLLYLYYLRL